VRLGCLHPAFNPTSIDELEPLCEKLDRHGLSAITPPPTLAEMSDDECVAFGERARQLGLVVGEAGFWRNLLTRDLEEQTRRRGIVRTMLQKADLMGCRCVVTAVGTTEPSDAWNGPGPYMFTDECKAEFRELILWLLDGLELQTTKYCLEAWCNAFFYKLDDITDFIDRVGHPLFGMHLDQMNLVTHETFYRTTELIHRTFDLLAPHVVSLHMKDIQWDYKHMFLKWDEVLIGDGVLDYPTYLRRIDRDLPDDVPCYCEHLPDEATYLDNVERLHRKAEELGLAFKPRA